MLEAFFQEYLIVPTAPVTVPAVTEPVLVPKQEASVLVEAAKTKAVAGCPTVTALDLEEQSSETVSV
jgi:hypothetical protein